ncbi:urease accessory protein [Halogranum rubrum]|uniref:Urease accessory protein n=1 Tax=Halogranum rubrum TaxID=553466 RepID=A0A1I4B5T0_9EURY|nr:urease accessory protein UreF [Halogranum rubrum]SFK63216.1 urease accessory protein [Halogranum rubrum]
MSDDGGGAVNSDPLATVTAFQLADSFLPVGTYTASYGLEQFVESDVVDDVESLQTVLEDYLAQQIGPCDTVVLARAYDAAAEGDLDGVVRVDRRQESVTLTAEFRESSTKSGGQLLSLMAETESDEFLQTYRERVDDGDTPGNYAAVFGAVAARTEIPRESACLAQGYGFVVGLLGAAQRLMRIGHTDTQRILHEVKPVIVDVVEECASRPLDDLQSFAPMVDVMSMQHERAERRLFVS